MIPKAAKRQVRIIQDSDYQRLEEIYLGYEGKTLPAGYFDEFRETIRNDAVIYLVAEIDGQIVGGGGIANYVPGSYASLTSTPRTKPAGK
jgi:hypothetical protein